MRAVPLLLIIGLLGTASADQIITYSFNSLPSGWYANSEWVFSPAGAVCDISVTTSGPYSASKTGNMDSDSAPIVLPTGTDSVQVTLVCDFSMTGWATTGESNACVWARAYCGTGSYTILYDSASWGFNSAGGSRADYCVSFPASAGQSLVFDFYAHVGSYFGANAHVIWTVSSLAVTIYGPTVLEHDSWAEIKACFDGF
jgi:hypothetical protein